MSLRLVCKLLWLDVELANFCLPSWENNFLHLHRMDCKGLHGVILMCLGIGIFTLFNNCQWIILCNYTFCSSTVDYFPVKSIFFCKYKWCLLSRMLLSILVFVLVWRDCSVLTWIVYLFCNFRSFYLKFSLLWQILDR